MKIAPAGDRALLIDFGAIDAAELHARAARVRQRGDVLACIVGHQSLYVVFAGDADPSIVVSPLLSAAIHTRRHSIEVAFDGADLNEFLQHHGLNRDGFLARVRTLKLRARYLGFRAAYAYLDGWPPEWAMPRRGTSRPVQRGSFAIAGAVAGFYTIDTPGGWNLLGRTDASLWDPTRTPPNLVAAGDEIEIVPVDRAVDPPRVPAEPRPSIEGVEVISSGQLTTIVGPGDWSRVDSGRSAGGPFDEFAASAANAAAGNDAAAPLFECALVGPRLRFHREAVVAWQGAVSRVRAGEEMNLGRVDGIRAYCAVGSEPLIRPSATFSPRSGEKALEIRVRRGPHETALRDITCEVTPQLDRVGIRLRPLDAIAFDAPGDLPSSGMQFGTIQLHPDRSLVAMGPDHPITGGYLQPLTVLWNERWKLAHLKPGDRVRFVSD
jgi:KipI family sensor histidine kinase inhibitor